MNIPETKTIGCLPLAILIALMAPFALLRGWGLWVIWSWFISPVWGPLSYGAAVGVCCVYGYLSARPDTEKRDTAEIWTRFIMVVVHVPLSVGVCWVLYKIVGVPGIER
jgi:hypothetical protein